MYVWFSINRHHCFKSVSFALSSQPALFFRDLLTVHPPACTLQSTRDHEEWPALTTLFSEIGVRQTLHFLMWMAVQICPHTFAREKDWCMHSPLDSDARMCSLAEMHFAAGVKVSGSKKLKRLTTTLYRKHESLKVLLQSCRNIKPPTKSHICSSESQLHL